MALEFQYTCFLCHPVATRAVDITTDTNYSRNIASDMAPGLGTWTPTWSQVIVQIPGIGMAFDGIRSHEHEHRP